MQGPMVYTHMPPSAQQPAQRSMLHRLVLVILLLLLVALIGGSLYWLQWASQRGITLGYPTPQVHITVSSAALRINQSVQFSANANGRDLTYTWDFGDGSGASGATVSHAYQANGDFTVMVKVTDAIGQTSSDTTSVHVAPPPPTASFTSSVGYYNYVSFDASGSSADPSTSIASYNWNFGDGNTDPNGSSNESHYYSSTGTYTVTLIVTDATRQQSNPYTATVALS